MGRRCGFQLVLACALGLAAVLPVGAAAADVTPQNASTRYTSFQFNMCDQKAGCPSQADHEGRAVAIANSFRARGANFMTLNEACGWTINRISEIIKSYASRMRSTSIEH